jgi:hypothetical protein
MKLVNYYDYTEIHGQQNIKIFLYTYSFVFLIKTHIVLCEVRTESLRVMLIRFVSRPDHGVQIGTETGYWPSTQAFTSRCFILIFILIRFVIPVVSF